MKHFVKYRFSIFLPIPPGAKLFFIAILLLNSSNTLAPQLVAPNLSPHLSVGMGMEMGAMAAKNINESASEIVQDVWNNGLKFAPPDEPIGVVPLQSSKQELALVCRVFSDLIKSQLASACNLKLVASENLADFKAPFDNGVTSERQAKRVGKLLGCKAFITGQVEDVGASLNINLFVWNATTGNIAYVASTLLRKDESLTALVLPYTGGRLEAYSLKWRCDIGNRNVHAIAVGDLNGDGQNELILATDGKLKVLAWEGIKFWDTSLKDFIYLEKPYLLKAVQRNIRTLHMADLNDNDRDEVYISVPIGKTGKTYRVEWQKNSPEPAEFRDYMLLSLSSSGISERSGEAKLLFSRFLELRGCFSGEQTTFLSVQKGEINPQKGQRIASDYNSIEIRSTDDDNEPEFVVVDHLGHVKIFNQSNLIWQSNPIFGVGLAITDLDGNGRNEIVCSSATYESPARGEASFQDNIFILEWDGDIYSKKWKSRTFDGSITDFTIADVDNDGILELVVCVRKPLGSEIRLYTAN